MRRHTPCVRLLLALVVLSLSFAGCGRTQPSPSERLLGEWTNSERLIAATPGEVRITFEAGGTARIAFDRHRYVFPFDTFRWSVVGPELVIKFGNPPWPTPKAEEDLTFRMTLAFEGDHLVARGSKPSIFQRVALRRVPSGTPRPADR